ncbi:hypothetical protein [Micromonospora sp. NPDC050200]|uniref:hypothetical protein n=1 Tax=Micromonospora sp. NPDC050200 TaxID=3155664 RepID=UPI0033C4C057
MAGRRQDEIVINRQQHFAALVVSAARSAVAQYAPEELEVFDGVAAGWQERTAKAVRQPAGPGSAVGFGIDSTLVSELFLQAVAAAASEVLVLGVTGIGAEIRAGWRRRRAPDRAPTGSTESAGVMASPDAVEVADALRPAIGAGDRPSTVSRLGLTEPQAAKLHQACRRHALALGLPSEAAELLADATVGAMVVPGER